MYLLFPMTASLKFYVIFQIALDIRKNTYYNIDRKYERGDAMKYSELEKMLKEAGCTVCREGREHRIWYSPITNKTFPVGRHKTEDVRKGTLSSIMRDAGLK